ncbi:MAG: AAA family ATPase [Gammaproteobacteria bacterium]|nr:AAA family ATPase [Gammaproteobacteria bacterium]
MINRKLPRALNTSDVMPEFMANQVPLISADSASTRVTLALGQEDAVDALRFALSPFCRSQHLYLAVDTGFDDEALIADLLQCALEQQEKPEVFDWIYVPRWSAPASPRLLALPASSTQRFIQELGHFVAALRSANSEQAFEQLLQSFGSSDELRDFLAELALHESLRNDLTNHVVPLVQHTADNSFPLYHCLRLNEARLFGDVRYESQAGTVSTHPRLLVPGLLHMANGGVLVIRAEQLLEQPECWRRLRLVLMTSQLEWQPSEATTIATGFSADPVPVTVKVILLGDRMTWAELHDTDPQLIEQFPLLVDVQPSFEIGSRADFLRYSFLLRALAERSNLLPLRDNAIYRLAQWAARQAGENRRVTLANGEIETLLAQASFLAHGDGEHQIAASHIVDALHRQRNRASLVAEQHYRAIELGQIRIQMQGRQIGQVNGLTVIEAAGELFGEPSRITASVHLGDGDVIDIERRSEMGGNLHAKGMLILSAFIHGLFSQDAPLPLTGSLVFEQSYFEVDGDSASLAELLALLSAMADAPLQQNLAVTGAIDQFGNVLAVGGVNEKIEGLWQVAQRLGITHAVGVLIPATNVCQLNLSDEVAEAVAQQQLLIYPIDHAEQAIELLSGVKAGIADSEGSYPANTLYGAIQRRVERILDQERPSLGRWFSHRLKKR